MITGAETMYQEVGESTMNMMMALPPGLKVLRLKFPEPVIDVARDKAARVAMMNGARWLFFTDSDIIMPPDTLPRLIAHDKPIVGGLYARRHHPPFNEMLRLTPEGQLAPIQAGQYTPGELTSCDAVATGCLLVRTDVFEKIKPFKMTIDGVECPPAWFLWTVDRLPPPSMSEDFAFCFPPDTFVQTWHGSKPIQSIKIGEKVVTKDGEYARVIGITKRPYRGQLIKVTPTYSFPIEVTPEHPFLIAYKANRWKEAKSLVIGDALYTPLFNDGRKGITPQLRLDHLLGLSTVTVSDGRWFYTKTHKDAPRIPNKIDVNPSLMRLFGYYIAEGYSIVNECACQLSFGATEGVLIDDATRIAKESFGVEGTVTYDESVARVTFSSKVLAHLFANLCGKGAANKHFPPFYPSLDEECLRGLIRGYALGDGQITPEGTRYTTVSRRLAEDVRYAHLQLGEIYGVTLGQLGKFARNRAWHLYPVKGVFHRTGLLERLLKTRIKKIEWRNYEGLVYNLEVEPSNTYSVGVTVHNCVRAKQSGIDVFCDTSIVCKHVGPMRVSPDLGAGAQLEFFGT
jgi:intein/homing endonuclease